MKTKIDAVNTVDFIDDVSYNTSIVRNHLLTMEEIKRNKIFEAREKKDDIDSERIKEVYINMFFLSCVFGVISSVKFLSGFAFFDIVLLFSYIAGMLIGIKSVLKLKEYNEKEGKVPLSISIKLMILSAFLISMPSLIT